MAEKEQDEERPNPFNAPRLVTDYFPRWIMANVPDVGQIPVVVRNVEEEVAVLKGSASFKVTKSAQGDTYEVLS